MPTDRKYIEQWSRTYHVLKLYVDFCYRFYFPTTISGIENIPKDKSIIFGPNHQNALIDALALLSIKTWQPIFLARADIFEKPLINKILTFLKILPIYRIRDGYGSLQKNDEVFNKTMDVLRNKNGLGIMPEGNHGDKKRLRLPLKKGMARIAFQTEDASNGTMDIHIVPLGIDYTHYSRVGSNVHLRFGEPIRIKPMLAEYRKNPALAYKQLLDLVAQGIKKEMIHIENEQFYDNYIIITDLFTPIYLNKNGIANTHANRVEAQIMLVNKLDYLKTRQPDDFLILMTSTLEFKNLIHQMGLNHISFPMSLHKRLGLIPLSLLLIILSPLFIYSFVNNLIVLATAHFVGKTIKDPQFVSSVKLVIGLVLFPICHLIFILIFALIVKNLYLIIAYAFSLPLSVYFFFKWIKMYRLNVQTLREVYCRLYSKANVKRAEELKQKIEKRVWSEVNPKEGVKYMTSYLSV